MKKSFLLALMASLCVLSACKEKKPALGNFEPVKADALLGKWTGPEGTFLSIEKPDGKKYVVTIQNLDGPQTFKAKAAEDGRLQFKRDGKLETISMGDGIDTGMKWLAEKIDCVVIVSGEGYCRD